MKIQTVNKLSHRETTLVVLFFFAGGWLWRVSRSYFRHASSERDISVVYRVFSLGSAVLQLPACFHVEGVASIIRPFVFKQIRI